LMPWEPIPSWLYPPGIVFAVQNVKHSH